MSTIVQDPIYLYKILPDAPPTPLPAVLETSSLDATSGFIHLSTGPQVLGTLNRFFSSSDSVYLLRIPYSRVKSSIKWDAPDGSVCGERDPKEGLFAHIYRLYGEELGVRQEEIDKVGCWSIGDKGWEDGELLGWDLGRMNKGTETLDD